MNASPLQILRQIAALLALAAIPTVLLGFAHPRAPLWSEQTVPADAVSIQTVQAWPQPPLWVDARSGRIDPAQRIPGALPLLLSTWDEQIQAVIEAWVPGRPLVVYCDQRACQESRHIAEVLRRDYSLDQVWVLHGGWAAWLAHSRP